MCVPDSMCALQPMFPAHGSQSAASWGFLLHSLPAKFRCRKSLSEAARRKQPRPGGLGLQKPNRRHKETACLSLADCIIACLDVWRRGRGTKFRGAASPLLMPLDYQTRSTKKALPVWTFVRLPLGVQYKKIDSVLGSRSFPYSN